MNNQDKISGQNIFIQSIEKKLDEREHFIDKACLDNQALRHYVNDLLKAHESANSYFNELEESITSSQLNEIEDHLFRDIDFGHYKIINILKQGGMGTIFLAQRSDGEFERTVVIKMIPIDLNFKKSQDQFAHEKEILASLTHPNIVQLYDSGITDKGQPYFVMELVKGKTLVDHCNDNKLNVEQRIGLFKDVLIAVGYAHQHLIIHGDIKPSNIMVNEEGQLKLLDFGIARLVNKNDEKLNGYSLNYLTPEHQKKQSIITTTDIHQLGQLLFELLTNLQPKSVRDTDFRFPFLSDIYDKMDHKQRKNLFDVQSTTKSKLSKLFHSDLQYILNQSLSINPQDRYNAIQTFSDDLTLYSKGYCINARQHTFFYRFSKYIKRNAMLTAFVCLLLVSSLTFVIVTEKHNSRLALERDKALTVKNLITDVFSAADPSYMPGKELTAVEVLDIGLKRVRERFTTHSEIEADLLQEIAHTYQNLGQYEKTQNILEEVYQIRITLQPKDLIVKAKTMLLLGENTRLMSNNEQAKKWLLESLEIFNKNPKKNRKNIASVKSKLGRVMVLLGDLDNAETTLNEATELSKSIYGEKTYEYAQALNDLNSVYFRQGKYQLVQKRLSLTKEIRENLALDKSKPILDKDYATNINNLGLSYYLQGKLSEGEKYFRMANDLRNKIYTSPHPEQAQSLTNLGLLLNDAGRSDEALPYLQQALKVRESTLSSGHMRINDAKNNLAMVFHESAQFVQAEKIYSAILGNVIKVAGEKSPQAVSIMTNRANTLLELNQFILAKNLFQKSLDYRLQSLPAGHLYLSYSYIGLGRTLLAIGEIQKSKELLKKALDIRTNKLPSPNWLLGEAQYAFALANYLDGNSNIETIESACAMLKFTKNSKHFLSIKCLDLLKKANQKYQN